MTNTNSSPPSPATAASSTESEQPGRPFHRQGRVERVLINIPTTDLGRLQWVRNLAAGLSADPAAYFIAPADAAELQASAALFEEAFQDAMRPRTRTSVAIIRKNAARAAALQLGRIIARQIIVNPRIPVSAKLDLGFRARPRRRRMGG